VADFVTAVLAMGGLAQMPGIGRAAFSTGNAVVRAHSAFDAEHAERGAERAEKDYPIFTAIAAKPLLSVLCAPLCVLCVEKPKPETSTARSVNAPLTRPRHQQESPISRTWPSSRLAQFSR
jgi:hypothetical protein